jgi:hypothetical protein
MFWGRGDTSRLDDEQTKTLAHLRRMAETGHIITLTPQQSEMAIRALEWYQSWEGTIRLISGLRNTAILVGFIVTIWATTEGTVLQLVKGVFK